MLAIERRIHDNLSTRRRRRFSWLVQNRAYIAQMIAEMSCWGVWDYPALERQLSLTEEAIGNLIPDPAHAEDLITAYAISDASLIHARGNPPAGMDCAVCREGRYGIDLILERLPQPIE